MNKQARARTGRGNELFDTPCGLQLRDCPRKLTREGARFKVCPRFVWNGMEYNIMETTGSDRLAVRRNRSSFGMRGGGGGFLHLKVKQLFENTLNTSPIHSTNMPGGPPSPPPAG